jgi:hypothetical protein
MVLLAAFMTQVGALQTAPILIAVITAFLVMEGVKFPVATRRPGLPAPSHVEPQDPSRQQPQTPNDG